ncbi:MAG: alpha-glucan family phosphorylase [Dehalococcoidia bacterium]
MAGSATNGRTIAYFSMELAFDPNIPNYSGGLGVLAGDTVRGAADLNVPMVAVSLVHRRGYERQVLDANGVQQEADDPWQPEDHLERVDLRIPVALEGRTVLLRPWLRRVVGDGGFEVPVYLLDAELPENAPDDQCLTDHLYGGDLKYRLSQEILLGMGGVGLLRALGLDDVRVYHMNEGHSALLTLSLLEEARATRAGGGDHGAPAESDIDDVRHRCVFTTHTPVPAGHDQFEWELAAQLLTAEQVDLLRRSDVAGNAHLNLTRLALNLSHFVNGVAMRHGQISRDLFPGYPINSITNGVHPVTWTSQPFQDLYDWHVPEWRRTAQALRHAVGIPVQEVLDAHDLAKRRLASEIQRRCGVRLNPEAFTIGFARRATQYKRPTLIFSDIERLRALSKRFGTIQLVFGGKAHPNDPGGKEAIRQIHEAARTLGADLPVVYVDNYDMDLAAMITAGTDLWLNTPLRPLEASGTSGMKAALNGVPSLSVLDGWWIEGHIEGVTGWAIGGDWQPDGDDHSDRDAESLYEKLDGLILPTFTGHPEAYGRIMRSTIAFNASFFNAHRMMQEYVENAYRAVEDRGA